MKKENYRVIGVMSGTSLDGIDLATVDFKLKNSLWTYDLRAVSTLPYTDYWSNLLPKIDQYSDEKVHMLNKEYTTYLAQQINRFIREHQLKSIDVICSHGHTVFHKPEQNYTLQIGNLPELKKLLPYTTVCDFRVQDVKLDGQGAPLVPIGDKLLFYDYQACINLGGFANISLTQNKQRIAYDICPVNTVLNRFAQKCGKAFDKGGLLAKSGKVNQPLLDQLNNLAFYQTPPPKSLGIEWVKSTILPLLEQTDLSSIDILSTYTQHTAHQLAKSIKQFDHQSKVLITGGGAYNHFLIDSVRNLVDSSLIIPDPKLVDYKEALIFGLLGVLKLRGEINVLKSVTGASRDHSSGVIYSPTKSSN